MATRTLSVSVRTRPAASRLACLLVGLLVCLACLPRAAWADISYSIDQVDIDATVDTDGSVTVSETRTFDFDDSGHGVYWDLPKGEADGRTVDVEVNAVSVEMGGDWHDATESSSGQDYTYSINDEGDYYELKIYASHDEETVRVAINYTDTNLAQRWADTGELYWKFVSDGWQVESQNVTCTVHLPVPSGQTVSGGDNVRAWGHGPLDASLAFADDGSIVYTVPGVGTDEFAEARVTFPAEWLSDATARSESKLDSILSEEQEWADEANAKRARARVLQVVIAVAGLALAVVSLLVYVRSRARYRRDHTPTFQGDYFRDVPTDDHPAALGYLWSGRKVDPRFLTASLMRLTDEGYVQLQSSQAQEDKGLFGRQPKPSYRVVLTGQGQPQGNEAATQVDDATLTFIFKKVARGGKALEFSELKRYAKAHPEAYHDAYEDWETSVQASAVSRGFFHDDSAGPAAPGGLAALDVVGAVGLFFALGAGLVTPLLGVALLLVLVACAIALTLLAAHMTPLSPEAVEIKAQLEALRRWLKDFTSLDEAVPHDVVLWNRLLVMAVVLDVADEVIRQLKTVAPEVLEDPGFAPGYYWWYGPYGYDAPGRAFGDALQSAHEVSSAALASSSSSSGSGGGGGFSGGGGGGFGGGGGGGAF